MRITRCFIDTELNPGAEIELPESVHHHLVNVLRHKQDHLLTVFNGRDAAESSARLIRVSKKQAFIQIESVQTANRESPLNLTLVQAIGKGEKMEFSIQKAVELGVSTIIPLYSDRSSNILKGERLQKKQSHWQGVAVSAAEQSGRTIIPSVAETQTLQTYLELFADDSAKQLMFCPGSEASLLDTPLQPDNHIHILIGPEGGFSEAEISTAQATGVTALHLGPRILRTETAGMTAISVLQSRLGDLG